MKHKHCELIKAWADGAEIEFYNRHAQRWEPVIGCGFVWDPISQFRIKPETKIVKYKIALYDGASVGVGNPSWYAYIENNPKFIKWIGEEQSIEVEIKNET